MKNAAALAIVYVVLSPSKAYLASHILEYRDPTESQGARMATLIHEFDTHRVPDPMDGMILYGQESWSFAGTASDLNRFLQGLAHLPQAQHAAVYFTGPELFPFSEPLTVGAAQSTVAYDWRVRVLQGQVTVVIPLAGNIPFAQIHVPPRLRAEADVGSPRIADVFVKLHNTRRQRLLDRIK